MQTSMISKIGRGLNHVEEYVLFLMVLQMGISVFIQVIMRYLFQSAITWLDELVHRKSFYLTFFGASLCVKYAAHISVDVLKSNVKREPYRSVMEVLGHLVMAVYVSILVYFGMKSGVGHDDPHQFHAYPEDPQTLPLLCGLCRPCLDRDQEPPGGLSERSERQEPVTWRRAKP